MNKHIAPYERVSHFIALISSGSRGVSCEQYQDHSKNNGQPRRDGSRGSATSIAMKRIFQLASGKRTLEA